jgi:putative ABC transport system permease protein
MFRNSFKIACRQLLKTRGSTLLNIAGLSMGIGLCLLIGIWLQRELSYDDFHPNGKSIFRIANSFKSESETFSQAPSGPALGAHLPQLVPAVKAATRMFRFTYKFKAGDRQFFEPSTLIVDSNFFTFFGFRLIEGRPLQVLSSPNQVVLTERSAIKYFGSVRAAMGKTILMENNRPMTVTGVAANCPVNTHLQFDILVPYSNFRNRALQNWKEDLDNEWVGGWPYVYVQLADPAAEQQVEDRINEVVARFSAQEWKENKMSYRYFLQPVSDIHLRSHLRYDAANNGSLANVRIFSIVGIIVLLLACINYINLTTAGAVKRAKETSVRKVIGATRLQLVGQFFAETFITCTLAVVLGILLLKMILPAFSDWMAQRYSFPITPDRVLLILGFILAISCISGLYPAFVLSSFRPAVALKGNFFHSARGNMIRKGLIVFQFTITIALLTAVLVVIRQMDFIRTKSLGFDASAVIEVNFNGDGKVIQQYATIRNELLKSPYIRQVTRHNSNVVGDLGNGWTTTRNLKGEEVSTSIYRLAVDADYLGTYGMHLAAGRFFSKDIPTDTIHSVLVNEAAVKTFGWQKPENAIGKPFGTGKDTKYVIGVVRDFNFESLHRPVDALLISYAWGDNVNSLSLAADAGHLPAVIGQLRKTWREIVPEVPLDYSFVDQLIAMQYDSELKMEQIFYAFTGLSLLIACLGLFGLTTFVVERKVKEIGIRKVLGASVVGIVSHLSGDFIRLVAVAALIALPIASWLMDGWLSDFAYRITIGWRTLVLAAAIAFFVALVTISFQAIRAATANPARSLRQE